jgi:hypothetical protein
MLYDSKMMKSFPLSFAFVQLPPAVLAKTVLRPSCAALPD